MWSIPITQYHFTIPKYNVKSYILSSECQEINPTTEFKYFTNYNELFIKLQNGHRKKWLNLNRRYCCLNDLLKSKKVDIIAYRWIIIDLNNELSVHYAFVLYFDWRFYHVCHYIYRKQICFAYVNENALIRRL